MEENGSSGLQSDDLQLHTIDKTTTTTSTSWADIVDEDAKEKRLKKKESKKRKRQEKQNNKKGRELFVGNIVFDDIENLHAKVADRIKIREHRRELVLRVFSTFGTIVETRAHWNKKYIFVVYEDCASALKAYASLQSFEQRKTFSDVIKNDLIASGTKKTSAFIQAVPKANYYVRWPCYYEDQHMEIEPLHSA